VDNFIEPFCGSGRRAARRPHAPRIETVNDADCMVANFWRATGADPEAVAAFADGPVNEADLHARHRWLVLSDEAKAFRAKMRTDPDYFDAKIAGWWCWGLCCWIGGGWCTAHGETVDGDRKQTGPQLAQVGKGVTKKGERPEEWNQTVAGQRPLTGVHSGRVKGLREKQPTLEQCQTGGKGVNGVGEVLHQKRPRVHRANGSADNPHGGCLPGVHGGHRPQLADAYDVGRGVCGNGNAGTCADRRAWLVEWFGRLRDRLRLVRVCCGDWLRVCDSDSVTTRLGSVGIFFDPPYGDAAGRDMNLYAVESGTVAAKVMAYCLERGTDPRYRIVLAGYAGEGHEALESAGWSVVAWKAHGGYGNRSQKGKDNAAKERLWFSPHCLPSGGAADLFAGL
jgi:hypothetical protein